MSYPWSERFIEIALRAIIKTHWNYQIWNMGQNGLADPENQLKYPYGKGIELADEVTVCSVITQDALNSPLFSGAYVKGKKKSNILSGFRYWKFNREANVYKNAKSKCDITVQRYSLSNKGKVVEEKDPIIIEAKRVDLYKTSAISEGLSEYIKTQTTEIQKDIKKFDTLKHSNNRPYLLLWGVNEPKDYSPTELVGNLDFYSKWTPQIAEIRWWPFIDEKNAKKEQLPQSIENWLYVILVELKR